MASQLVQLGSTPGGEYVHPQTPNTERVGGSLKTLRSCSFFMRELGDRRSSLQDNVLSTYSNTRLPVCLPAEGKTKHYCVSWGAARLPMAKSVRSK